MIFAKHVFIFINLYEIYATFCVYFPFKISHFIINKIISSYRDTYIIYIQFSHQVILICNNKVALIMEITLLFISLIFNFSVTH